MSQKTPKPCKRYASGSCRYQNDCAYSHRDSHKIKNKCEHTDTINILEKIVREITLKFMKVDQELKDMKEQLKIHEATVNHKVHNIKERENVAEEEKSKSNTLKEGTDLEGKIISAEKSKDQETSEMEIKPVDSKM